MSESYEKQITDLQSQLAESKAANKALEDKIVAEQQAEFDAKLTNLEETIAEQSTKIAEQEEAYKVLAEQVTKHEATIAEKEEAIASKQEELDVLYKKEAVMKRVAQLTEAGFDAEEATATVEKFESVNDEIFAEVVALAAVKKKAEMKKDEAKPFPPKKDEDKDEEKDAEAKPMKKMAELDEERDVAEVDEEALAQAEETEEVAIAEAMGEDDPAENLRSVASEWLGSVLQSNNK